MTNVHCPIKSDKVKIAVGLALIVAELITPVLDPRTVRSLSRSLFGVPSDALFYRGTHVVSQLSDLRS